MWTDQYLGSEAISSCLLRQTLPFPPDALSSSFYWRLQVSTRAAVTDAKDKVCFCPQIAQNTMNLSGCHGEEANKQRAQSENNRRLSKSYLHMMERTVTGLKGVHVPVRQRNASQKHASPVRPVGYFSFYPKNNKTQNTFIVKDKWDSAIKHNRDNLTTQGDSYEGMKAHSLQQRFVRLPSTEAECSCWYLFMAIMLRSLICHYLKKKSWLNNNIVFKINVSVIDFFFSFFTTTASTDVMLRT